MNTSLFFHIWRPGFEIVVGIWSFKWVYGPEWVYEWVYGLLKGHFLH